MLTPLNPKLTLRSRNLPYLCRLFVSTLARSMTVPRSQSTARQPVQPVANACARLDGSLTLVEPAQNHIAYEAPDEDEGCRAAGEEDGRDYEEQRESDNEEGEGQGGKEAEEEAGGEGDKEGGGCEGEEEDEGEAGEGSLGGEEGLALG